MKISTPYDRNDRRIRWAIGFAFYLICGGIAYWIATAYGMTDPFYPALWLFLLGYLAGRVSKGIER